MQQFEINAELREDLGKGASRRLRTTGKFPGVIYGANKDAVSITLVHNEFIHKLEHEAFFSHILTLNVGKQSEKVVLKDLHRHPFKTQVLHVDFQRVDENQKLTMRVPLHFINEKQCVGVKQGGGVISHIVTEIEISCLPKDLPEYIDVDLLNINLGETVHLGNLKLPEGVEIYALTHGGDEAQPIVSVHVHHVVEEEEVEVETIGEVEAAPAEDSTVDDDDGDAD